MSDSGFSGLPPGPRTGDVPLPQSIAELKAKIIELRGEIKAAKVRQKLEGEILRHNKDGTTTIRTDKGELTVELRGRERPPPGTRVEIDLPPGNPPGTPPKQATVRPAPERPAEQRPAEQQPAPPPPKAEAPREAGAPPQVPRIDIRTAEDLARYIESLPPEQRAQLPLREGDIIRLLPLSAAQAQEIIRPQTEVLRALLTALPHRPQIQAAAQAFANISPALTLPHIEHALLAENLPRPLPLFTQATAAPLPQERLERLPLAARTPVQQLLQYILQANQPGGHAPAGQAAPFTITAPPVTILPAGASFFTDTGAKLFLPTANRFPALFQPLPLQADSAAALFTAKSAAAQPLTAQSGFLDVRISTIEPFAVKLTGIDTATTKPQIMQPIAATANGLPQGLIGSITGEITGLTPQLLPVLTFFTPGTGAPQNFVMQFPAANLPPGTQVQIVPQAGKAPPLVAGAPLPPFVPFEFFSGFSWGTFEELAQTLQQAAPQAAQVLANVSANPAAPARLPMAALFFLAAVRSGDISGWLGDRTVDTLRRLGKGDLVSRLERDAGGLQRTSSQPAGEWRATALPMMWDGLAHKMMLYYRHDEREEADGDDEKRRGTRFIFDLNLNRLGDLQLDGLHRAQGGRKARLDLIVRTKAALSAPMQQYMRRLYIGALEQTDLVGELSFQNKPEQFIKPEMPKRITSLRGTQ